MHVVELYTYPIKSARGIALSRATLDDAGIQFDRRFMFVDADGNFLTQRVYPRMALIEVTLHDDSVRARAPGLGEVDVPLDDGVLTGEREVNIWRDRCVAHVVSREATDFAREFFGIDADLVRMPSTPTRSVDSRFVDGFRGIGFADAFPLLVASRASLDAVNATLATPIPMRRFRPNIVVDGTTAFAEDAWRALRVGDLTLTLPKPCERCVIVNVDPESGTSTPEALRALAKLHTVGGRVLFGQNAIHDRAGELRVGDVAVAI